MIFYWQLMEEHVSIDSKETVPTLQPENLAGEYLEAVAGVIEAASRLETLIEEHGGIERIAQLVGDLVILNEHEGETGISEQLRQNKQVLQFALGEEAVRHWKEVFVPRLIAGRTEHRSR